MKTRERGEGESSSSSAPFFFTSLTTHGFQLSERLEQSLFYIRTRTRASLFVIALAGIRTGRSFKRKRGLQAVFIEHLEHARKNEAIK